MCDTFIAMGKVTKNGRTLFGKNSDREPNEPQGFVFVPAAEQKDKTVKTTYIEIPQVPYTRGFLLSKPSWLWGGEMGINDGGVVIGNEAVFTKEPVKDTGLPGMDIVRLVLERADNSERAMEIIIELIQEHGQGGNCGYDKNLKYHNSFIVADKDRGFVIETAGDYWAAKEITGIYSISNALTIGNDYDYSHPELIEHARKKHWSRGEDFKFNEAYGRKLYAKLSGGEVRQRRAEELLMTYSDGLDTGAFLEIARDHNHDETIKRGSMETICMHGGGLISSQTTSSMVCELGPLPTTWITGTSSPCLSLFKPVWIPDSHSTLPYDSMEQAMKIWFHWERFHRTAIVKYADANKLVTPYRQEFERRLLEDSERAFSDGNAEVEELKKITREAFEESWKIADKLIEGVKDCEDSPTSRAFRRYWKKQNHDLRKNSVKSISKTF